MDWLELWSKLCDIFKLSLEALQTEGEHHKQWYLEEICKRAIMSDIRFDDLKDQLDLEEGRAP